MNETAAVNLEPDEPRGARGMDVAQARRMAIDAARRIIARGDVGRMTLDSVGHEAGLPIGALASHFNTEQELLMAVAADDLAALAKSMRDSTASSALNPVDASLELIQRVEVMENAFTSMIGRHQKSLLERNDIAAWVEQSVKALQQRVDGSEDNLGRVLSDVKAARPAGTRSDPPLPAKVARLLVEPPPMDAVPPPLRPLSSHPPAAADLNDLPPVLPSQTGHETSNSQEAVFMDNYLLEARRAAIATQAGSEHQRHESNRRSKRSRMLVGGVLGSIAIVATAAIVLNRNVVTAMPSPVAAPSAPQIAEAAPAPEAKAPLPEPPQVAAVTPADPAPSQLAVAAPVDKLTELAATGDVKAERDLGLKYLAGDGIQANENEAARWLMRAAYRGEPTAEYWLGTLYARGHGVPADAFQANHWYEAAAQKGNRRAMHSFAVAYFQGWGVEKNYSEAARWFRSAADLGFVDSQFNLAVLYERGAGIPQSLTEAYKWYAIAAHGGDKEADTRIAVLATQLAPAELALAQQAAASFKPAPLNQNANLASDPPSTDG